MIDDDLRSIGPGPLSDPERRALRSDVLASIGTGAPSPDGRVEPSRRALRVRRSIVVGVIAAAAVSASAAAAYVGFVRPDPGQAATIVANSRDDVAVHNPGWRPELNAEEVACDAPGGQIDFNTSASAGRLEDSVQADDLVAACASKAATLDQAATAPNVICRSGTAGAPTFAAPAVLLGVRDCSDKGLDAFHDSDLAALNEARAAEVAIHATSNPCPSRAEVLEWVRHQVESRDLDLTVIDAGSTGGPPDVCFGTWVDWVAGTALVDALTIPN
ncbi:MAG: hypothetical protein ACTHN0_17395 [Aquihabitans sp.]